MTEKIELGNLWKKTCAAVVVLLLALFLTEGLSADDSGQQPSQPQALTFLVTNINDSGPGSLRQAIISANANPGLDVIHFNIPGVGVHSIKPSDGLPGITDPVIIDGLTQPGASNATWPPALKIEIDYGSNAVSEFGLEVHTENSLIRGLVINRSSGSAIDIYGASNQIKCNFLGTDPSGTVDRGNAVAGVFIAGVNSTGNVIGGAAQGEGNVLSGNGYGLAITQQASGTVVQGNYIGTNAAGTAALMNSTGVHISASPGNAVGGTSAGARNLISGNQQYGVEITGGSSSGNTIAGNYIGTEVTGTVALGNGSPGIQSAGVVIQDDAHDNIVGGTSAGARNIISGNRGAITIGGIYNYLDGAHHNRVQGNYIGTDVTGAAALGNVSFGVCIVNATDNAIGGTTPAARNVISATYSSGYGVGIFDELSTRNLVQGNYIGTDATGAAALGNSFGVLIATGAFSNTVGGTSSGAPNVISGNNAGGVHIYVSGTTDNRVEGNYIGLDASGEAPLGNGMNGVKVYDGASGNYIGGLTPGTGNKIAYSSLAGVRVESPSVGNRVVGNSIFANGGLGIDLISGLLGLEGVTSNDPSDSDTGSNNLQNYPVLTTVSPAGGVSGSLNSTPNTLFRLEFYASAAADPSGHGEGEVYLGTQNVTTGIFGIASFSFNFTPVAGKPFVTTTATNTLTGDTSEFSSSAAPTAVSLATFEAKSYEGGVLLEWQTGFEVDNLGFRIYRQAAGQRQLVNREIIAGSALTAGSATVLAAGQAYTWWDELTAGANGAQYWLEDLDLSGQSTWHGPFYVKPVGGAPPWQSRAELLSRRGRLQSGITLPAAPNDEAAVGARKSDLVNATLKKGEVDLASIPAVKIAIRGEGWYRVGRQELFAAGLDANVNPQFLQLFTNGVERPIMVTGEKDGVFDAGDTMEFYAEGLETASTDLQVHWLVEGKQPGLRITTTTSAAGGGVAENFSCSVERRDRTIYFPALRNGERENFFGPAITTTPVDQTISISHPDGDAREQALLEVVLQGVTIVPHRVGILLNGINVGEAVFLNQNQGVANLSLPQSLIREGANEIQLTALGGAADVSLVDYVRLTYKRSFIAENNRLRFTTDSNQQVTITGFTAGEIRVFDVTNPAEAKAINATIASQGADYAVSVSVSGEGSRQLLAIASDQARHPDSITHNVPSKWRQKANGADLIILTRSDIATPLRELQAYRQSQGVTVETVDIEDVYDEFSHGQKSPQAIKDFLAYAKTNWKHKPAHVLLGGDASLDPKNYFGLGDFDLVPTKLVDTEFMETASDDWLADFDNDGLPELTVGRLPFRSVEEAGAMVSKIISYENSRRAESLLLVADANDGFDFAAALAQLKPLVPADIKVEELQREEGESSGVRQKLMAAISAGQTIVNYTGHGSINQWRGNLLSSADVREMTNKMLPVFVMMTCLNGYFQDPAVDSLAESLVKAERGGAAAVWASTGMTMPGQQALMNQEFYRQVFSLGSVPRLGEAVRRAKAAISDRDVRKTWVLIGDPTLKLN